MLFQRKMLSPRRQITTGIQCGILARIAELGEPSKMLIRCTKSQAVNLGPLSFICICSGKTSRRRSIVPCGIDDSDLVQ